MTSSRPQSIANASGPKLGHRRGVSSKANTLSTFTRSQGTSVVPLFLTNLRLLNLDLQSDWPAITSTTFASNGDARVRIKCSEWALYHLFRLYDGHLTADKLQPFFPPLEPLQSINLRAALYRCLDLIKKNGVLGREVVLRKTMLDDCSGDKFLELCLAFSSTVLRKATLEKKTSVNHHRRLSSIPRPIAQNLGSAQSLKKSERESLLPLAVAHKAALTNVLREKERKRQSFARLSVALNEKDYELQQREERIQQDANTEHIEESLKNLEHVERNTERNWTGSSQLRDSVLMGDETFAQDALLEKKFDDVWIDNELNNVGSPPVANQGTLASLEARAQEQNDRLRKWQEWHNEMRASEQSRSPPVSPSKESSSQQTRFDLHRKLAIRSVENPFDAPSHQRQTTQSSASGRYDEILAAMREDLRRKTTTDPNVDNSSTQQTGRSPQLRRQASVSFAMEAKASSALPENRESQTALRRASSVSRSPPVPVIRPGIIRRNTSRGHQPTRIEGQTAPIPLKSEIFSPLKRQPSGTSSRDSASSNGSLGGSDSFCVQRVSQPNGKSSLHEHTDSAVGFAGSILPHGVGSSSAAVEPRSKDPAGSLETDAKTGARGEASHPQDVYEQSDVTLRPSLAERARQSMAFNGGENTDAFLPSAVSTPKSAEATHLPEAEEANDARTTEASLIERTRQSISLAPRPTTHLRHERNTSAASTKPYIRHTRSRTSIFPVNQFETPQKKRRSSIGNAWLEGGGGLGGQASVDSSNRMLDAADSLPRRDITPREKLFQADAEYDSIFKSRPKVAQSPPSMVDPGDGAGDPEDEESFLGNSSPLAGPAR
ncbi:hypothetical protein K431DRAFT_280450 [Polychaeton citri CBS 116435]|uniref:HAUS augmin-like complex subunit 6 N-terminal domain-containing protein n=1 Tax=Polychaeton citri CBS 116435 TaxID=1314669 RepID=A0A9P4QHM9_9PEZI|nr:hypothetical protein K431DRAFT_280450 [Polychaeton citri CBS 116435]